MPAWSDVEAQAPELAARARGYLDAHVHKTLATLRRAGELWFGSMPRALKAADLQRDARFALHSGSEDPPGWTGDAKVAGRAEEVCDPAVLAAVVGGEKPPGPMHLFRAEIGEVSVVALGDPPDHLVIESWHDGRGVTRLERA